MINALTGEILFSNTSQTIVPGMKKSVFIELFQSHIKIEDFTSNNYYNYILEPMELWSIEFSVRLTFNPNDKLEMLKMWFYDDEKDPWKNWSKEREIEIKNKQDQFLEQHLGKPPYEYTWGGLESSFDLKGGFSSIVIRYYKNDFGKEHVNKEDSILHKAWDGIKKGLTRSSDLY